MNLPGRGHGQLLAAIAVCTAVQLATADSSEANLDLQAVQTVCARCHTTAVFMNKPRSWERWNDVFADMTQRGANGTNEQLARVTAYFLANLTLVNVNTSPVDELAWVLGVGDEVAASIVARRQQKPFATIVELRGIPGVDAGKLEQRKNRISF